MSLELEERLYSTHMTVAIILIPFPFIFLYPTIKNSLDSFSKSVKCIVGMRFVLVGSSNHVFFA